MRDLAGDPEVWGRDDRPGSLLVAIVGGGSRAWRRRTSCGSWRRGRGVVVLEAESRPGGVLRRVRRGGLLIESAAERRAPAGIRGPRRVILDPTRSPH